MIHTIETIHDAPYPPAERVPRIWAAKIAHVPYIPPAGVAPNIEVQAEIAESRWLARCPDQHCAGAELVSKQDPRFWCCSCQNEHVGGLWIPVVFPKQAGAIEDLLNQRPRPNTRTWQLTETVKDLAHENAAHGVGH